MYNKRSSKSRLQEYRRLRENLIKRARRIDNEAVNRVKAAFPVKGSATVKDIEALEDVTKGSRLRSILTKEPSELSKYVKEIGIKVGLIDDTIISDPFPPEGPDEPPITIIYKGEEIPLTEDIKDLLYTRLASFINDYDWFGGPVRNVIRNCLINDFQTLRSNSTVKEYYQYLADFSVCYPYVWDAYKTVTEKMLYVNNIFDDTWADCFGYSFENYIDYHPSIREYIMNGYYANDEELSLEF